MWLNRLQQTFRSFITNTQEESKFFSSANSSSSSSVILESKYDVFLSFRGEDTRHNFTAHLYEALCREKIATFIDDDGLKKGDEISPVLLKAIEDSKVSVIIFSKDYASSRWCLDELQKIVECRKSKGQIVVPVFYHIDPSDIRKQTGSYRNAFVNHHKRFKKTPERVQKWRAALTEAANLSGHHLTGNRSESKLVEEIVRDILKKLTNMSPLSDNCDNLVGTDIHIEKINWLLKKSTIVGIWGMGGIGKTTIVEALYRRISRDFDSCCFINVGKQLEKHHDQLVNLQQEIISKILGEGNIIIDIPSAIPQLIKERLQRKKILVVLDDVNNFEHLEFLIIGLQPLHVESRIIATTRDKQVLSCCEENHIYEVERLNHDEAPLLFYKYACKENHAPKHLQQLSKMIIGYAKGHPLTLKVEGSLLHRKSEKTWESVVLNLKEIANPKILDVLKISYDGLTDMEKSMFLDIACFLNWEKEYVAKEILKACYEPMEYCFEVLISKALIKTSDNMLQMHDLLQEMGREIVLKECENNPGKRSRLWDEDDVRHVLQNNKGTKAVKGIFLDVSALRKEKRLSSEAFVNMVNLRVLKLYCSRSDANISKFCLPSVLEDLPNELRYLHWDKYPWGELPSKFSAEKLVALNLPSSKSQKLWEGAKDIVNLKLINVSKSEHMIEFPNLQNAPKLETLILRDCKRLFKFPSYIPCFNNLRCLNMRGCQYLRRFPWNIRFQSPVTLNFSHCINLTEFPKVSGNVKCLFLEGTAIEEIPASTECLTELETLRVHCCKKLKSISPNICKLSSVSWLDFSDCSELESFPEFMEEMKCLESLMLHRTAVKGLPSSIERLVGLNRLGLCSTAVTQLPSSLCLGLVELNLSNNDFESLPTSIKQLSKLRKLDLTNCNMLQSIPELPLRIEFLCVDNCKELRSLPQLPSSIEQCDDVFASHRRINFNFGNCVSLIESISQERVEHMATALELFYKKIREFEFWLPGCEMPEWFNHSFGSSITIERPQQYCGNRKFIGFALSAVVVASGYLWVNHDIFWVRCCYSFGVYEEEAYFYCSIPPLNGTDHIAISFCPAKGVMLLEGGYTTVTFNFSVIATYMKLKCCGVCPIYEEPNMCSPALMLRDFLQVGIMSNKDDRSSDEEVDTLSNDDDRSRDTQVETMSHEDDRSSDKEVEMNPKRNCINQIINSSIIGGLSLPHVRHFQPKKCTNGSPAEGCQMDCCGVPPVNAEPNISQPNASNKPFAASSEDLDKTTKDSSKRKFHEVITSESEIGKSNEQEVEPQPKRICKNQINSRTEKFLSFIKCGLSSLFRRT